MQPALFSPEAEAQRRLGAGPVLRGVRGTIRTLCDDPEHPLDRARHAGLIEQCKALARAVDRATGHNVRGWQDRGADLAQLHNALTALWPLLDPPSSAGPDPFADLLAAMSAPTPEELPDGHPEASHRPQ